MSQHPLIELANDREVRQSKGFREAAERLTGEGLAEMYQQEVANAPKRHDSGKKYLGVKTGRIPSGPQSGKDDRHLAMAIKAWAVSNEDSIESHTGDRIEIIGHIQSTQQSMF